MFNKDFSFILYATDWFAAISGPRRNLTTKEGEEDMAAAAILVIRIGKIKKFTKTEAKRKSKAGG